MFDKQMFKQLEKMMGQMNPSQKKKLADILKDEESIKKALAGVDPAKAKKVVENLNLDGMDGKALGDMAAQLTKNPDIIEELDKK